MSIRYKIFGAFSVVILLACGLAFYGIRGISTAGDQVVRLYDGPLMGINHARSAHAGLNEARLVSDEAKRAEKYKAVVAILQKDYPVIYLYFEPRIFAMSKKLQQLLTSFEMALHEDKDEDFYYMTMKMTVF